MVSAWNGRLFRLVRDPEPVPELADHQPPQLRRRQLRRPLHFRLGRPCDRARLLVEAERRQFAHDPQRALPPRRTARGPGPPTVPAERWLLACRCSSVRGATHTVRPPGYVRSTEMLDHSTWPGRGREEVSAGQRHKKRPQ